MGARMRVRCRWGCESLGDVDGGFDVSGRIRKHVIYLDAVTTILQIDPTPKPHTTQSDTADMAPTIDIEMDPPVQASYDELTLIPDRFKNVLPLPTITISELIAVQGLPPILRAPLEQLPTQRRCLTTVNTRWSDDELLRSPIPALRWLGPLLVELRGRVASGNPPISLKHPSVDGLYLPVWVAAFWDLAYDAVNQRDTWVKSVEWLRQQNAPGGHISRAMALMNETPWGRKVSGATETDIPLGILAEFISDQWLRERHFDMATSWMRDRGGVRSRWWYGPVYFASLIQQLPAPSKQVPAEYPRALKDCYHSIREGAFDRLVFPAHINGNHWIAFRVDLTERSFCYGESPISLRCMGIYSPLPHTTGNSYPTKDKGSDLKMLIARLACWLRQTFKDESRDDGFRNDGGKLAIGMQRDTSSCGVCVISAIEHAALAQPMFHHDTRNLFRIRYFVEVTEFVLNKVGALLRFCSVC
jgi:hypothetical protein